MESYDVIIVGAGPAGGNCARELSKLGHSVLLIEKSKTIGVPNFSTGGTPNETMKVFDLPKKVTDSSWNSLLVASKGSRAEFIYKKRVGYVLNYKLLKQFLVRQAKKYGSHIITGAYVNDTIVKNNFVKGVSFSEKGKTKEAFAKVVVDASGGRAILSQKLGLLRARKKDLVVALEYHMNNVNFERKGRLDFYLGKSYAPGGYAWIFPASSTQAKVGIGIFTGSKGGLINLLSKFAKTNPQTKNSVQTDLHGGSIYATGGIEHPAANGFLAIGDAAGQINPLGGEGIRHALYSGLFAAETIDVALQSRNTDEKSLEPYNVKWKNYVGRRWKISLLLARMMYGATREDNDKIDKFVHILSKIDQEDLFEIFFNYRFERIKNILPTLLKIVAKRTIDILGL